MTAGHGEKLRKIQSGPRAYSVLDAAKLVGVDKSEIYRAMQAQRLKWITVDARRLIPASALREFLTAS
jgi:excisionase family DNA binding protein